MEIYTCNTFPFFYLSFSHYDTQADLNTCAPAEKLLFLLSIDVLEAFLPYFLHPGHGNGILLLWLPRLVYLPSFFYPIDWSD